MKHVRLFVAFLVVLTSQLSAQQPSPDPRTLLRSGPMLGYTTLTETGVWLQTTRPADVQIRFWKKGDPTSARISEPLR
ncbi:MAG TPA: phosphodiesterase, partial [Thermoanaerobaculia bacterium]|nr:phosphodiesterase [Thermoanaerobaculia bacterium]